MSRVTPGVICAALSLAVALGPTAAAGQELPPEVQIDLYLVRADRHILNQNWAAALEALDIVLLLQADQDMETPAELWFTHARAALEAGYPQTAITSASRYLREAGRGGQDYAAALVLLDEAIARAEGGPARTPTPTPAPARPGPGPARVAEPARVTEPARVAEPVRAADPVRAAEPAPAAGSEPAVEPAESSGGLTVLFPLVGVNAATMAFTTSEALSIDASQRTAVGGGFGVAFPISGRYGVQIGAQFAKKGAHVTLGAGDVAASADVTFETVDIMALARIAAPPVANLPLYALVGPYASFELDCRVLLGAGAGGGRFTGSNDCRSANLDTRSMDFGVSGGVGIEAGTGETRVTVGLLYSHGLQDIDKYVGETARHRVFNIHAGVARAF